MGIPLIFLSSDDKGCQEALDFMPWIETVATKHGYGRTCARSKHPVVVEEEIYSKVIVAVERRKEMGAFTFDRPIEVEIHFKKFIQVLKARLRRPGWCCSGILSIKTKLNTMQDWLC